MTEISIKQIKEIGQFWVVYTKPEGDPGHIQLSACANNFRIHRGCDEADGLKWVVRDIENGDLYVCEEEGELLGVFYFSLEADPDYVVIENGAWRNDAPHGIIHRVASSGTRKGVFPFILDYCKGIVGNIRMDTHAENKVMQHVLEKQGFVHCGTVYVRGDSPRMAYHYVER